MQKPRSISFTHPKRGFTLVELLLALAITAMVLLTLAYSENSMLLLWTQESLANEVEQHAEAALERVAHYASIAQSVEILPQTMQFSQTLRMRYWDSTDQKNKTVDFYLMPATQIFYEEITSASAPGKIQAALYLENFTATVLSQNGKQLLKVVFTATQAERPILKEQCFYLRNCLWVNEVKR